MASKVTDADWHKAFANVELILPMVPEKGGSGEFACPCCKVGTVRWARARVNGHLRFACSVCNASMIQ